MHTQLKTRVIDLYQELLLYLIKSVCSYHRNRFVNFLRDTLVLDGWDGSLKNVKDAEKAFQQDSSVYNTQRNTVNIETLANIAISSEDKDCLRHLRLSDPRDDKKRIEQTKGGLLQDSYRWILDNEDFQQWRKDVQSRLLWIKGDPGKGKTMLLCGIIDEIEKTKASTELVSYFFCQATDSRINTATAVLRGLMYLLIDQQPLLISHLRKRYDQAGQSLFEDANTWVVLSEIFADIAQDPGLEHAYLVVDALDECIVDLPGLLNFIVRILSSSSRLKWIVSSRNWPLIEECLERQDEKVKLSLELNAKSVSKAVHNYVEHKVHHLAKLKGYEDETMTSIRKHLLANANDTFPWVALVCQNLENTPRWKTLTTMKTYPPGLNPLYQRMMQLICDSEDSGLFKQILALAAVVYRPITLHELKSFIEIPKDVADDQIWLEEPVKQCGSFLTVRESTIYFVHQSAKDFVLKNTPDEVFPSGAAVVHYNIYSKSMEIMSKTLRRDLYDLRAPGFLIEEIQRPNPDPLAESGYACLYWVDHLAEGISSDATKVARNDFCNGGAVAQFLSKKYLYWLEALSLLQNVSNGVLSIIKLDTMIQGQVNRSQLVDQIRDARRFILYYRQTIDDCPLQVYTSALLFSPVNSLTKEAFNSEKPKWVTIKMGMENDWSACLQTLQGHSRSISAVAFSPDGKQLASGSNDETIRLWDFTTGGHLRTLEGHSDWISAVAFSPDGKQLASGSGDKTIRLWDATTGDNLQIIQLHVSIRSLSFHQDPSYLETDRGLVEFRNSKKDTAWESRSMNKLFVKDDWIMQDAKNILWLPSEYRPNCLSVRDNMVSLGHASGKVTLFEFNMHEMNR